MWGINLNSDPSHRHNRACVSVIYMCIQIYLPLRAFQTVYICLYTYIYVYIYVCIHNTYIHIYIFIYVSGDLSVSYLLIVQNVCLSIFQCLLFDLSISTYLNEIINLSIFPYIWKRVKAMWMFVCMYE